jgi:hypothetical protein
MTSNAERGRLFQEKCREALQLHFGKNFLLEVKVQIAENKWHPFDLATEAKDIVAECKAFAFTASGNNPSAKITTIREAVQYLRAIPGSPARLLLLKACSPHPGREPRRVFCPAQFRTAWGCDCAGDGGNWRADSVLARYDLKKAVRIRPVNGVNSLRDDGDGLS